MAVACRDRGPVGLKPEPSALTGEQRQRVLDNVGLARSVARRFRYRGEPADEIEQVALFALVKSARRFEPERNTQFSTFATVSITGELKRHFRDHTWGLRVVRSMKEAALNVSIARSELEHRLGRSPTAAEIADHLALPEKTVLEAMVASHARYLTSLDCAPPDGRDSIVATLASKEDSYSAVLDRERLRQLLPALDERARTVLHGYFFEDKSQQQLGAELGISQMQVSRTLASTLCRLRAQW